MNQNVLGDIHECIRDPLMEPIITLLLPETQREIIILVEIKSIKHKITISHFIFYKL